MKRKEVARNVGRSLAQLVAPTVGPSGIMVENPCGQEAQRHRASFLAALLDEPDPTAVSEFNQAVDAHNKEDWASCLDIVSRGQASAPSRALASLGHACAAQAEDLDAAERYLAAAGGSEGVESINLLNHALALHKAGRAQAVVDLITPWSTQDPNLATARSEFLLLSYIELEAWDEALKVVDGNAPQTEAHLAFLLMQRGRRAEARRLLVTACPRLEEEGVRGDCDAMLAQLGGP